MSNYNTAYDDVFRTLLVDCSELIIPFVNEVFHTNYVGDEDVILYENEIFMRQQDGKEEKIVTDSSFAIVTLKGESKRYHLECQSSTDGSMLIRMYEYDIGTIFDRKLLFLIPFYIFTYEKQFSVINNSKELLEDLKREYSMITKRLELLVESGKISEYVKKTICEMSERVLTKLAAKFENIQKEVTDVMGGKVLEYEAKDILRKGIAEGIEVGTKAGVMKTLCELVKDNLLSIEEAAKRGGMTIEEFQKELNKV